MSGHRAARRRAPLWVMTLRVLTVVAFIGAIVTAPLIGAWTADRTRGYGLDQSGVQYDEGPHARQAGG